MPRTWPSIRFNRFRFDCLSSVLTPLAFRTAELAPSAVATFANVVALGFGNASDRTLFSLDFVDAAGLVKGEALLPFPSRAAKIDNKARSFGEYTPTPHPYFAPKEFTFFRSTQNAGIRRAGSRFRAPGLPFTRVAKICIAITSSQSQSAKRNRNVRNARRDLRSGPDWLREPSCTTFTDCNLRVGTKEAGASDDTASEERERQPISQKECHNLSSTCKANARHAERASACASTCYTSAVSASRLVAALPLLVGSLAAWAAQHAASPEVAEVLYLHGDILTGAHLRANDQSATPARVSAVAVRGGRILAVGSDTEMLRHKGPATRVIDLGGAFAMPGFNDAHVHLAVAGQQKLSADLGGTPSLTEMQARIREYASHAGRGSWLVGGGWDQTIWPGKQLPTRGDLDAVTNGHPAIFRRVDEHMAVANSLALAAAGITRDTPNPPGASIDRDPGGEPTGILREAAASAPVYARIPPPSLEQRRQILEVAISDALANGVTSVQDNSEWEDFLALEELEHAHSLKLRVAEWLDFKQPLPVLWQRRASHPAEDPLLHLTQLKGFLDGSLGSRTAALDEPYADDPGNTGLPRYDVDELNAMAAARAAAGFQIGFHAIGDRANGMALDAFAAAEQTGQPANRPLPPQDPDATIVTEKAAPFTPQDLRLRVEHAQVLQPADFDRFRTLGVIASMQPSHLLTDGSWAADRLGPDRSRYAYAWHSFLAHGVTVAFGTDYPVESINPMRGLYSAITRQNEAGTRTFQPQERISLNEAIYAYTQASAFAEFRETLKGRLEPGFVADLIVLDHDITGVAPQVLLHTRVLRTVVDGETVFIAPATAQAATPETRRTGAHPPSDATE